MTGILKKEREKTQIDAGDTAGRTDFAAAGSREERGIKQVELRLEQVSKSFAKVETDEVTHALNHIDLSFHSGEFISLVGPSGCGKSTILRIIAGLINPTTGKAVMNGQEILSPSPERGMVFQKPTLFPWLTVEDNIAFSLRMQRKIKGNENKVDRMLKIIGLEHFRADYPGQLSGGMAQRVALARSLINEPSVLLLDEPLGALDAFTRMNMQDEILRIWREAKQLVVMVTHDVDEAIYMGTRVIVMDANPGRIVADLPISESYPRDRSSDAFVAYRNRILNLLHFGGKEAVEKEAHVEEATGKSDFGSIA